MKIDLASGRAIYLQIMDEIVMMIVSQEFKPGEKIPTVRELALKIKVNPNTVQRAFSELESLGIIITKRTSGRIVCEDLEIIKKLQNELALKQVEIYFENMIRLGHTKEQALELIKGENK